MLARRATKISEDMVNNGRSAALQMPVLPLEGGEMIVIDGEVVGAVGVSSVKAGEVAQVVRPGVAAIDAKYELMVPFLPS